MTTVTLDYTQFGSGNVKLCHNSFCNAVGSGVPSSAFSGDSNPGTGWSLQLISTSPFNVSVISNSLNVNFDPAPPTLNVLTATNITFKQAALSVNVNPNFWRATVWFRVSSTSTAGCADTDSWGTRYPSSGGGVFSGTSLQHYTNTVNLYAGTSYSVCAFASNSVGGQVVTGLSTFTTPQITIDPTDFMNWAESVIPDIFPPTQPNSFSSPYIYRVYPNMNILGIANGEIYLWGPISGNAPSPVDYDSLSNYGCRVYPTACPSVSAPRKLEQL